VVSGTRGSADERRSIPVVTVRKVNRPRRYTPVARSRACTTTTAEITEFLAELSGEDLSAETREEIKKRILDSVGIGIAALGAQPVEAVHETVRAIDGDGPCTLWGRDGTASPVGAAMHNTALTRYLDFMDSYLAPGETPPQRQRRRGRRGLRTPGCHRRGTGHRDGGRLRGPGRTRLGGTGPGPRVRPRHPHRRLGGGGRRGGARPRRRGRQGRRRDRRHRPQRPPGDQDRRDQRVEGDRLGQRGPERDLRRPAGVIGEAGRVGDLPVVATGEGRKVGGKDEVEGQASASIPITSTYFESVLRISSSSSPDSE